MSFSQVGEVCRQDTLVIIHDRLRVFAYGKPRRPLPGGPCSTQPPIERSWVESAAYMQRGSAAERIACRQQLCAALFAPTRLGGVPYRTLHPDLETPLVAAERLVEDPSSDVVNFLCEVGKATCFPFAYPYDFNGTHRHESFQSADLMRIVQAMGRPAYRNFSHLVDSWTVVPALHSQLTEIDNDDFSGAALSGMRFDRLRISAAQFMGAQLIDTSFQGAVLNAVNFTGAHLQRADFRGAQLQEVNFSNVDLAGAQFTESRHYYPRTPLLQRAHNTDKIVWDRK